MSQVKRVDYLVERLIEAKEAYYNTDEPLISDAEFDSLEEELLTLDPQNTYFAKVGSSADEVESDKEKISHKIPMLSMQKAKRPEDVLKWMAKIQTPFSHKLCVQPKIDGISATCFYNEGKLQYVATRGDGKEGQDITHIAEFANDVKNTISFSTAHLEIRGELYLPKDTEFNTGDRPLRNNCAGLINRKDSREDLKYIRFAVYQIAGESGIKSEHEKIDILREEGFNAVEYFIAENEDNISTLYNRYLEQLRDKWLYETDGLIFTIDDNTLFEEIDSRWVVDHHHHYAIALKPPAESRVTPLENIEWQVSRQGNIVPVAVFKPVKIGGAKISRATLNNYDNVVSLDLRQGDELLIERANDVIPFIKENISIDKHDQQLLQNSLLVIECPSCKSELFENGVHRQCRNRECPEINIQQILYWVKQSNIETVAEATVRVLYDNGRISSISDLYGLTEKSFEGIQGFAEKKISKILSEITQSKKISPADIISRLGIPLVQKKALKKLNIATIDDFMNFEDDTYVIGRNIIQWRKNVQNMKFFEELISVLDVEKNNSGEKKGLVCMTGKGPKGRKEIIADIENMGYEFSSSVTKETDILLCDDVKGKSSKIKKALQYGVELVTYSEFFKTN